MNSNEVAREEAVNPLLGQLLRTRGVQARSERRSRGDAPDIRFELSSGELVLVECKWDGGRVELDSQLAGRVADFPRAFARVGVLYPDRLKRAEDILRELERATDMKWFVHSAQGDIYAAPPVREGTVDQLAEELRTLPLVIEGYDVVRAAADEVRYAVEQAAARIAAHANIARRIADVIAQADKEKDRASALRIGCLVLFNALAFENRLSAANESVPTVGALAHTGIPKLRDAWLRICREIDYVPVFELAAEILNILGEAPTQVQSEAIAPLIAAVEHTDRIEGHDLSGRLFHTLLSDAKFTGAYYTSVPAAMLLARLVFEGWPAQVDWSDHEFPASLSVADLACGTGTLLMAVATEVKRRHEAAGGRMSAELHKAMVEQALHGYDVQLSAIHFAATSLAMLNPRIEFDRMNLYVMPLGVGNETVSLGSLDFLGVEEAAVQHSLSADAFGITPAEAGQVSGKGLRTASGGTVRLPDLDLAIMNPPFTRAGQMLFGMLPPAERRKLQQELSSRLRKRSGSAVAGLGAAFVATATPKLRAGEGRLALVLPATLCTGSSWQQTRSLIERDFRLDMVIASHDPERWNFSDSTNLSEVLVIATRRAEGDDETEHRTAYVNLWRNPDTLLDAQRAADAIAETLPAAIESPGAALLRVGGRHVGESVSIPMSRFRGKKWGGVQFSRADLTRSALSLLESGAVRAPGYVNGGGGQAIVPLCALSELGEIGPDRRGLIDAFDRTQSVTTYPMVEGHDTDNHTSITCVPNAYLSPLAIPKGGQRPGYGDHLWTMSSRLLVAERLRLDTARVLAVRCDQRVLSNVWWEINVDDEQSERALAVWLNSTLGILSVLSQRTTTEGGWVASKKGDLARLPVLDTRALPASVLSRLGLLFDSLADLEFKRLPGMAECPARLALDEGLAEMFGLPPLDGLRRLLASEPVISNQRL